MKMPKKTEKNQRWRVNVKKINKKLKPMTTQN
jgi:hypothetical protein